MRKQTNCPAPRLVREAMRCLNTCGPCSLGAAKVDYPPHSVNRILSLAILSGDTALVRRILLSGLRPDPAGNNSQVR